MTIIFEKEYDYEGLYDIDRDIGESFDESYNPNMANLPTDENNMIVGTFKITIEHIK